MSAKNRGPAAVGPGEYASTPFWAARSILEVGAVGHILTTRPVVDLGAGRGEIASEVLRAYPQAKIIAIDKFPQASFVERAAAVPWIQSHLPAPDDARQGTPNKRYAFITNPPFSLAKSWLEEIWQREPTAPVLMLQRTSWLHPERMSQSAWSGVHRYHLTSRPAFAVSLRTGKVGTDACEYCWYWWPQGLYTRSAPERWLPRATKDEIREANNRLRVHFAHAALKVAKTKGKR